MNALNKLGKMAENLSNEEVKRRLKESRVYDNYGEEQLAETIEKAFDSWKMENQERRAANVDALPRGGATWRLGWDIWS